MNFLAASSIIRSAWFIEESKAAAYYEEYMAVRAIGGKFRASENEETVEAVSTQKFFSSDVVKYAPTDGYSRYAREFTGFDGAKIAVIVLDGPLMKADYCGMYGTASLLNLFNLASITESVQEIVLLIDSPGGTVDGTFSFADAIAECEKPVTAIIDGYCCSAAYWIGSSAGKVYATSPTDIVGSIGTMCQLIDQSKYLENLGVVVRTFYATDSADKNAPFEKAQKGDGKLLVKTMLDPLNNEFKAAVMANRLDISKDALSGRTYVGNAAKEVGLIDGVMCIDDIMSEIEGRVVKNSFSSSKIYNMSVFQKTLKAAGAASFKVVEGGFLLEENHLNAIEASLATIDGAEAAKASAATLQTSLDTANSSLSAKATLLIAANDKVIELQEKLTGLGKLEGARFSAPPASGKNEKPDVLPGGSANDHSYLTDVDAELKVLQGLG